MLLRTEASKFDADDSNNFPGTCYLMDNIMKLEGRSKFEYHYCDGCSNFLWPPYAGKLVNLAEVRCPNCGTARVQFD